MSRRPPSHTAAARRARGRPQVNLALTLATLEHLARLAARWGCSRSGVVERAVAVIAAAADTPDTPDTLDSADTAPLKETL